MPYPGAERAAARYLAVADRLLPGRITGCYLVGSAALDAWRAGRSDIDFIAVVDGGFSERELRRLRVLHVAGNLSAAGRALVRADPTIPGTMNGAFVPAAELGKPVTRIRPLASHSGRSFKRGRGFDVNPVMWKVLREQGVTVRGPAPDRLGLDPEPDRLREWNLDQLRGHWRDWAQQCVTSRASGKPLVPAHRAALARVLGPPRLHHTIATGAVISKEAAAEYALDVFDARWHPLLRAALAQRTGGPGPEIPEPGLLRRLAGEFTLELLSDAERLAR
ncbi:aminoglycoside adenylyltransferase domain-containing protein [Crossiella sp. NPDC003009]